MPDVTQLSHTAATQLGNVVDAVRDIYNKQDVPIEVIARQLDALETLRREILNALEARAMYIAVQNQAVTQWREETQAGQIASTAETSISV